MRHPHIHNQASSTLKTWRTVLALTPVLAGGLLIYQALALKQIACVLLSVLLGEFLGRVLQGKKPTLYDGQSILSGCLLAALIPPTLPLWLSFCAGFFAILLYREFFGGVGQNPFQGILVTYIFLQISFPLVTNYYVTPFDFQESVKPIWSWMQNSEFVFSPVDMLLGKYAGGLGTSCAAALLVSALLLIWQRLIFWETAVLFLAALCAVSALWGVPVSLSLLSGNGLLTAFFLIHGSGAAIPHSRKGLCVFAFLAGAAAACLRHLVVPFDGCLLAVLMMNGFSPWLDRLLRPHGRDSVLRSLS